MLAPTKGSVYPNTDYHHEFWLLHSCFCDLHKTGSWSDYDFIFQQADLVKTRANDLHNCAQLSPETQNLTENTQEIHSWLKFEFPFATTKTVLVWDIHRTTECHGQKASSFTGGKVRVRAEERSKARSHSASIRWNFSVPCELMLCLCVHVHAHIYVHGMFTCVFMYAHVCVFIYVSVCALWMCVYVYMYVCMYVYFC